jgi:hypothetical protein
MKKLSLAISTLVLGGIFVFISCTKTGPTGPAGQNGANGTNGLNGATGATGSTGPTGPIIYGTITGNVIMTNIYGVAQTNYSGGYILLKNAASNARVDSVYANSSTGAFAIDSVPTGTYNMYCIYSGYGTNVHQNVEVNGNLQVDNKIAQIPTFTVSTALDTIYHKRNTNYLFGTIAPDAGGARTLLVFIGNTPSVSAAPGTYSFTANAIVAADSTSFTITTPVDNFYAAGFSYGSTAFIAIYGAADNYNYGDYTNYTYGQLYYSAISANPFTTVTIVLP